MSITERIFGKTALGEDDNTLGEDVKIFTMLNCNGTKVEIMELGATIVSMTVPNKMGKLADLVLGYDSVEKYEKQPFFMGAILGRGLSKKIWKSTVNSLNGIEWVEMTCKSADMEDGHPGNLEVSISYYLMDNNSLEIEYFAISDKDTNLSLTSHPYFNLKGHGEGDILDHELQIFCNSYTENNNEGLPNGKIISVGCTPMDFREKRAIGQEYDDNWVLPEGNGSLTKCAVLSEGSSGRSLEVQTTLPGLQLFTGNNLDDDIIGKNGAKYVKNSGLCIDAQFFPNSMKHKNFPSIELRAFEKYRHKTVYRFR